MRRRKRNKSINQIKLFRAWLADNIDKFIFKPVIFYRKPKYKKLKDEYLFLRYEGIINNIVIRIDDCCMIDIQVENLVGLELVDLLTDFLVALRTDDNGKYYNESLLEDYRRYYDSEEQVFYDEFNLFLRWSNDMISEDKFLYVYNLYNSMSIAKLITPEQVDDWKPKETKESISNIVPMKKQPKIK